MSVATQSPETDLLIPRPAPGEQWDSHTVHTHYFGFNIPEHAIGTFAYIRYMPALGVCHAGFQAYQGLDNVVVADCLHHDYQIGCDYPDDGGARFTANGLTFDFVNPGKAAQITYRSADGRCRVDVRAEAITPLAARGHVIPGEELHTAQAPGGSEQFMHYTGELELDGQTYTVDCNAARDRSWRQVRTETLEANAHPPVMWTPVYFGPDLAFNQVGFAAPDSNPLWLDAHQIPDGAPTHHFAWVSVDGEIRDVVRVHRQDLELHPLTFAPLKTLIDAEDETGREYTFLGEAIGHAPLSAWPNIVAFETLFRWEDDRGRVAYGPGQSIWNHVSQKAMRAKAAVRRDRA